MGLDSQIDKNGINILQIIQQFVSTQHYDINRFYQLYSLN